jgi:hypothetical protein
MAFDPLDQAVIHRLPRLADLEHFYGVQVNALGVDDLFSLYERTGFLYPDKAARLTPHLGLVKENWRRMLSAGESLLYVLTAGDDEHGRASLSVWRTTSHGCLSQHLVSESNPFASRAVLLAAAAKTILERDYASAQNWFRPENRFPARVFGSMVQTIGSTLSSVQRHVYFALPKSVSLAAESGIRVVPFTDSHTEALSAIASASRGSIYLAAEELMEDVAFEHVDAMYREVGLSRRRYVWLAYREYKDEPIGAAIAYRGPLGLNFSFIENRCDLLLHPTLPDFEVPGVVSSLLNAARSAYEDFELDQIPVIAEQIASPALFHFGAEFVRNYCQGIWLEDGHPRFYRHVDSFYTKLLSRAEKHSMHPPVLA